MYLHDTIRWHVRCVERMGRGKPLRVILSVGVDTHTLVSWELLCDESGISANSNPIVLLGKTQWEE